VKRSYNNLLSGATFSRNLYIFAIETIAREARHMYPQNISLINHVKNIECRCTSTYMMKMSL
jgi:hypothetical protein